ncbi:MAG: EI24 domain-containing protein [Sulfurimonas sp.]|jgi:hypothetical protein|nr:EI24 domain-containing protein [Sulfurimonadaceae bacterium]
MSELKLLARSVDDFLTLDMLKLAILPLFISFVVMFLVFYSLTSYSIDTLKSMAEVGEIVGEDAPFYTFLLNYMLVFLFKYSITSWLSSVLLYVVGSLFVFYVSLVLSLIIVGFLTPLIVKKLHKKHYHKLELNPYGSMVGALVVFIKSFLIMLILYVILVPIYFIPLVNIIAFYIPLYYLFHKLLNYDVSSSVLSLDEYKHIYSKKSNNFRAKTLLLYAVSTIPFVTLFIAVFYAIYLANSYFVELEKLQME